MVRLFAAERYGSLKECLEGELNPHEPCGPTDFKSGASADSATQATLESTAEGLTKTFRKTRPVNPELSLALSD
jgi:hypothetical protein